LKRFSLCSAADEPFVVIARSDSDPRVKPEGVRGNPVHPAAGDCFVAAAPRNDSWGNDSWGNDSRGNDSWGNDSWGNDSWGNDSRGNDSRGNDSWGNGSWAYAGVQSV
jgi:hypothetical protein